MVIFHALNCARAVETLDVIGFVIALEGLVGCSRRLYRVVEHMAAGEYSL